RGWRGRYASSGWRAELARGVGSAGWSGRCRRCRRLGQLAADPLGAPVRATRRAPPDHGLPRPIVGGCASSMMPAIRREDVRLARKTVSVPRGLLLWLTYGSLAPVLFTVVYLIEGVTRPGYDGWKHSISALSLGPGGWLQQANFVFLGLNV